VTAAGSAPQVSNTCVGERKRGGRAPLRLRPTSRGGTLYAKVKEAVGQWCVSCDLEDCKEVDLWNVLVLDQSMRTEPAAAQSTALSSLIEARTAVDHDFRKTHS
jgi:hypothetical protein